MLATTHQTSPRTFPLLNRSFKELVVGVTGFEPVQLKHRIYSPAQLSKLWRTPAWRLLPLFLATHFFTLFS